MLREDYNDNGETEREKGDCHSSVSGEGHSIGGVGKVNVCVQIFSTTEGLTEDLEFR